MADTYPKKNQQLRAKVDNPDVFDGPDALSSHTLTNLHDEAQLGDPHLRPWKNGEVIGTFTGLPPLKTDGRIYYQILISYWTISGFIILAKDQTIATAYVPADQEHIQWYNTEGESVGDGGLEKADVIKQLDEVYYPKWSKKIPHYSDLSQQSRNGTPAWYITFPNKYGQFLDTFDKLSDSAKEQLTGVADVPDPTIPTVDPKTKLVGGTTPAPTPKSTLFSKTNIILGVVILAAIGVILTLTLRKKPQPPLPA